MTKSILILLIYGFINETILITFIMLLITETFLNLMPSEYAGLLILIIRSHHSP